MSRENVEVVRRLNEAFNRGDMDTFLELLHPDVEWVPILAKLEGTVYQGRDAVSRWVAELHRDWAEFHPDPQEFRDLGGVVLALGTWHARARTSGLSLDSQPGAWLARIRDRKIVRYETFTNRSDALEAAGLRE
jgi:ketosteroid isomerase-like protein